MSTFVWPPVSLSIAASPTSFLLNGSNTTASQDTSTPANSNPLPVVSLSSTGQVIAPATEAKQDDAITQLSSIDGKDFATEATLELIMLLTVSIDGKDFATQTTLEAARVLLASLDGKDFSTGAKQDTLLAEIQKISSQAGDKRVLDGYYNASLSIQSASRTAALVQVPASRKATELEILIKGGETFSAYDASTAGNLIGKFTQAGGRIPVNLAATTEIFLESDNADFTATDITINLIGVDA